MIVKLLDLTKFDVAEILVDDSGSMCSRTDARGPQGEPLTRWHEAKLRILQIIEVIAYVTAPIIYIRFLNRSTILELLRRPNESPEAFYQRAESMVQEEFSTQASGLTPALERIRESLARYRGKSCLRYFMGDGVPNGGEASCKQIEQLLLRREQPEKNPFTFMSCTDQDGATEWMKELEEVAPFCSEFDDYKDEAREILKDQGKAFPYSYGLHLVAKIVAAFNLDDLDAMDESVPFAKQTLEDLLGYQTTQQECKYYFDSFLEAQHRLPLKQHQNTFVRKLPDLFPDFTRVARAADIAAVAEYRLEEKELARQARQQRGQAATQSECCVIL